MRSYHKFLLMLALIVLLEIDFIPFRRIGFHCGDPKISYKFRGDTIPVGYLFAVSFAAPLIAISLVETVVCGGKSSSSPDKARGGMKRAWHWYGQFVLGLLIVIFITQAGKAIVQEPRPHFLDTCRPDTAVNCTSGYVSSFKCTNLKLNKLSLKDSTKSFPSGHSALGVYMAVFMIWFFQRRVPESNYLVVPWLQCLFAFWGMLCALTRITDHRHHWWDVLAGTLCGVGIAVYTIKVFCKGFLVSSTTACRADKLPDSTSNGRYPSSRRLLSSTSSYTPPDDRELREVQLT